MRGPAGRYFAFSLGPITMCIIANTHLPYWSALEMVWGKEATQRSTISSLPSEDNPIECSLSRKCISMTIFSSISFLETCQIRSGYEEMKEGNPRKQHASLWWRKNVVLWNYVAKVGTITSPWGQRSKTVWVVAEFFLLMKLARHVMGFFLALSPKVTDNVNWLYKMGLVSAFRWNRLWFLLSVLKSLTFQC